MRSVRAEHRGTRIGAWLAAALIGLIAVLVRSNPVGPVVATMAGAAIGACLGSSISAGRDRRRYEQPQPWPSGVRIEAETQTVLRMMVLSVAGVAVYALLVTVDGTAHGAFLPYAVIWIGFGIASFLRERSVARIESALGVTLYRDLRSWRRLLTPSQTYARTGAAAAAGVDLERGTDGSSPRR